MYKLEVGHYQYKTLANLEEKFCPGMVELAGVVIKHTHDLVGDSVLSFIMVIVSLSSMEPDVTEGSDGEGGVIFRSRVFDGEGILSQLANLSNR